MSVVERPVCSAQRIVVGLARPAIAPKASFMKAPAFAAAAKPAKVQRSAVLRAAPVVASAVAAEGVVYETMIVLRPDLSDEQRDMELAKFEAFLKKEAAQDVKVTVRGRQRLAYPIKSFSEGIYVLYTYGAAPHVSQAVQKNLSTPEAGSELNILRHMTFKV